MKKILYLTYDGLLEPLGYSQIICYLKDLSKNYNITIISVEKKTDLKDLDNYKKIKKILDTNNINWKYLKYNRGILKYFNFINLLITTFYFLLKYKHKIIHARSYLPASIAYLLQYIFKINYFFDMRGLWIDERIDWKLWKKNSFKFIIFSFLEKHILTNSHSIISLTNDGIKEIKYKYNNLNSKIKFYVIPTSVEIQQNEKIKNKSKKKLYLTHLGSIGTRYNFKLYLKIFKKLNNNDEFFLSIINKGEHSIILNYLKEFKIEKNNYLLEYVKPYQIKNYLNKTDFGLFFPITGNYLKAYFPTKLGEFLSRGIPVITNKINSDVDSIIINNNIGIIIEDNENINYEKLQIKLKNMLDDKGLRERCVKVAKKYFDISIAVSNYSKIYNNYFR